MISLFVSHTDDLLVIYGLRLIVFEQNVKTTPSPLGFEYRQFEMGSVDVDASRKEMRWLVREGR